MSHWKPVDTRPVVPGCAGGAMTHPDFGRSVNPISTMGDRLCPTSYYWHTQIFRLSDGPGHQRKRLLVSLFDRKKPPDTTIM